MPRSSKLPVWAVMLAIPLASCGRNDAPPASETAAPEAETLTLTGDLSYRQRIALPRNAVATVELRAGSPARGTVIGEQRIPLDGRQVPAPFSLRIDRSKAPVGGDYYVSGAISIDGAYAWVSEPLPIDLSSAEINVGTLLLNPNAALAFASSYRCGDTRVEIGVRGETMQMQADGKAYTLQQAVSASGAKYETADDPETFFWTKGDSATLSIGGQSYPECREVDDDEHEEEREAFKARGNEPGWNLAIEDGQLTLVFDYGARRLSISAPEPEDGEGITRYYAAGHDLDVLIEYEPCADDATGMPHPSRVTVTLGAQTLHGCGGEPATMLIGGEWAAEDIDGPIVNRSRATLAFDENGGLSGRGSCNSYRAEYALTGEGLSISNAAATLMACAPALLEQEQRFFDILSKVDRFEIDETGALILHAPDGRRILARR